MNANEVFKVDWVTCPSWWNYVAIDKNGDYNAFDAKPEAIELNDIAEWVRKSGTKKEKIANFGPYQLWKQSLIMRQGPQIVPEHTTDAVPGWEAMVKKDGKWVKDDNPFQTGMMTPKKCEGNCTCGEKKDKLTRVNLEACRPSEYLLRKWRKGQLISICSTEWVVFDLVAKDGEDIAYVALNDQESLYLIDNVRFILNCQVAPFYATEEEIEAYQKKWFSGTRHVLYENGDANIPEQLIDSNGDVVLSMCKVCGRAESELDEPCTQYDDIEFFFEDNMWGFVNTFGEHTGFHNAVCVPDFVTFLDENKKPIDGFFTKEQGEVILPKYARFKHRSM